MPLKPLDRESEPYSQYGNISADGIQRLLGAPHLDALQILVRETVQNSWDAGKDLPGPVDYQLRFRTLTRDQHEVLRDLIFRDLPRYTHVPDRTIRDTLNKDSIRVIEICDAGTTGLGGPTHPDAVPDDDESPDFVDFMRNIGSPRDTVFGGGTYGYGKSCLSAISECQTIIVDSATEFRGEPVRRFMASRVANRYDISSGNERGRYTGRHWWGRRAGNSYLEPVTGREAAELSASLGMFPRSERMRGTSIMILAPELNDDDLRSAAARAIQILLWFCWPKVVPVAPDEDPPMRFAVEVNGEELAVPAPDECPPLDLYARALRQVRQAADESHEIRCDRPKKHVGRLSLLKGLRGERCEGFDADESLFPSVSSHVALMRPAELVVRYLQGEALPSREVEWGGVFICSDEHEVEHAFSSAEPPAHDDWDPRSLPKGPAKTFVNVALRRIREHMTRVVESIGPHPGTDGPRTSLGMAADTLGELLTNADGSRLGTRHDRPKTRSRSLRKPVSLSRPVFAGYELLDGRHCARFSVTANTSRPVHLRIEGTASIMKDGGGSDATDARGERPGILGWRTEEGGLSGGSRIELLVDGQEQLTALTLLPEGKAIAFHASYEEVL